jgi:hypothetical protein
MWGGYRGGVTSDSSMAAPAMAETPGPSAASATRYRCAACGNLTRFSVVTNRRTKAFHHFSVGGELTLEDVEVLDETVEEVSCRWCGNGNAVETVDNAETVETGSPNPN